MLSPGTILQSRYRIVCQLGAGGMGSVYLAEDIRLLGRRVAIKQSMPDPTATPQALAQARQQFLEEARVLATLDHPTLPKVSDFFSERGNEYLVMDYVEGEDLAHALQRVGSALPEKPVLIWAEQVLDALDYLHNQNPRPLIHRDIKPSNLVLTPKGKVKLVDFGLVKLLDPNNPYTATMIRGMGSPIYAPLEQYTTDLGYTDVRSDLYSLGATLYHLLTHSDPPDAPQRAVNPTALKHPRQLNPKLSSSTEQLLLRALEVQPAARFQSAAEMKQELVAVPASHLPPTARIGVPSLSAQTSKQAPTSSTTSARRGPFAKSPAHTAQQAPASSSPSPLPKQTTSLFPVSFVASIVALSILCGIVFIWLQSRQTAASVLLPPPSSTPTVIPTPTSPYPVHDGTPMPHSVAAVAASNANQVIQLARYGKGQISQIAWSPDGKSLAVATSMGIYLYESETLTQIRFIETAAWIRSVAFHPDGEILASGGWDNKVRLWEISSGRELQRWDGHTDIVGSVAFDTTGDIVASGSFDNIIRLWRTSDGSLLHTLEGHSDAVQSVAFSADGELLASGSNDGTGRLWQVDEGKSLRTLQGHTSGIVEVAFSPDGRTVATAATDGTTRLWWTSNGAERNLFQGDANRVYSVDLSPDNLSLVSGSSDQSLTVWETADGTLQHTLSHDSLVRSVAFSPNGELIASASWDGTIRLWGAKSGRETKRVADHTAWIKGVEVSPDGETIVAGSIAGTVHLQRVGGEEAIVLNPSRDKSWLESLALSPDGSVVTAGMGSGNIIIWDLDRNRELRTIDAYDEVVRSIVYTPNGDLLATGATSGAMTVWTTNENNLEATANLRLSTGTLTQLVFGGRGNQLISATADGAIYQWQIQEERWLEPFEGHEDAILSLSVSGDGQMLATGSTDGTVKIWDINGSNLLHTLQTEHDQVTSLAFVYDGTLLAAAVCNTIAVDGSCLEGSIQLWQVEEEAMLHTLEGHTGRIEDLTFSPDDTFLISGAYDGTVRLWGLP